MTTEVDSQAGPVADGPSDAELITAVRAGDNDAYATLYTRHHHAALRLARTLARDPAEADDLVADAFTRILTNLQAGKGPDLAFRAYLHTTIRHTFYDRARAVARTQPTDEVPEPEAAPAPDPAVDTEERRLAARAFHTLPERWQLVLWHTEVEGDSPAQVAPLLGLTPNGVAALAYRARERLRQAYLQAHLADTPPAGDCGSITPLLAAEIRGNLSARDHGKVSRHLESCATCAALHTELVDLNTNLGGLLAPAILGTTWAAYLGIGAGAAKAGILATLAGWPAAAWAYLRSVWDKLGPRNVSIATGGAAAVAAAVVAFALVSNDTPPPPPQGEPPAEQPPAPPAEPPTEAPTETPPSEPADSASPPAAEPTPPASRPPSPAPSPSKKPPKSPDPLPKPPIDITPGAGNPTLRAGRSSVLPITIERNAGAGGSGGGTGVESLPLRAIPGETGSRMILEVRLPDRVWLASHVAGHGWRCLREEVGDQDVARCAGEALDPGESTTAELRLYVAKTVTGSQPFTASVTLNGATTTEAFDVPITGGKDYPGDDPDERRGGESARHRGKRTPR